MNKDKQIDEMAKDIYMNTSLSVLEISEEIAEYLTAKGYRKASEVAREFIEAVDEMMNMVTAMTGLNIRVFGKYAELKKKYTKEE